MRISDAPIKGSGSFRVVLPPVVRAGVEFRPAPSTRVELAYVREFWSMHDDIRAELKELDIGALFGTDRKGPQLAPISLKRGFVDSDAIRLGGEHRLQLTKDFAYTARGGIAYETSAVPTDWVSNLSYDANKVIISGGGGLHLLKDTLRLDGGLSFIYIPDFRVNPDTAQFKRIDPFNTGFELEAINGGDYKTLAVLISGGLQYKF
jgi:long-subunit fatty acid transport protein